jgi:hypothetical protein
VNNALIEEISSQHESKMMKKLEQMEGGPKSMDQIPAKMTKPHLPLRKCLHPNLDQVPSQLPRIQSEQEHMWDKSITVKQTPACKESARQSIVPAVQAATTPDGASSKTRTFAIFNSGSCNQGDRLFNSVRGQPKAAIE